MITFILTGLSRTWHKKALKAKSVSSTYWIYPSLCIVLPWNCGCIMWCYFVSSMLCISIVIFHRYFLGFLSQTWVKYWWNKTFCLFAFCFYCCFIYQRKSIFIFHSSTHIYTYFCLLLIIVSIPPNYRLDL